MISALDQESFDLCQFGETNGSHFKNHRLIHIWMWIFVTQSNMRWKIITFRGNRKKNKQSKHRTIRHIGQWPYCRSWCVWRSQCHIATSAASSTSWNRSMGDHRYGRTMSGQKKLDEDAEAVRGTAATGWRTLQITWHQQNPCWDLLTPIKSLLRSLGETNGRSRALPWTCGVTMSYKRWAIANTCRSSNYTWCPICRTWSKQTHRIAPANRWSRAGTISLCSLCERMIGCKAVRPPDVALS